MISERELEALAERADTLERMSQYYDATGRVAEAASLRMAAMLVRREQQRNVCTNSNEPGQPGSSFNLALKKGSEPINSKDRE